MVSSPDLLSHIRARIDELIKVHTDALISAESAKHDRIAGKIEALQFMKNDLGRLSRSFQSLDEPLESRPQYKSLGSVVERPSRVRRS